MLSKNRFFHRLMATLVIFLSWPLSAAFSEQLTFVFQEGVDGYTGYEDTTIFAGPTGNSGGGTDGIFSGTIAVLEIRRALIRCDLSSIPQGASVLSASLDLTVVRARTDAPDTGFGQGVGQYRIHTVAHSWGEGSVVGSSQGGNGAAAQSGDATWTSRFFQQTLWDTPGGDFATTASAEALAAGDGSVATWSSAAMAGDVQAWLDDPTSNFGWIIIAASEGTAPQDVKKFGSSEAGAASRRPKLTVVVDVPVFDPEDIDHNGAVNAIDIQFVINAALGLDIGARSADVNNDNGVNALDIQLVINAALGL